jgi:hypothetical protein
VPANGSIKLLLHDGERTRTAADQTLFSNFWNSSRQSTPGTNVALYLGAERHMTLLQNALVLGALSIAMADAKKSRIYD